MTYQDIVNIIRNAANYVNPDGVFIHGRKTDGSLQYNESFPQIILLEPTPNTSINNNSFVETISFPIIFVAQDTPETTELRREDLKQEMYLLSRKLLSKIDENELLQNVSYAGGQPEIRQMSGTATGFSYTLEITYPLSECTLDFDLPPTIQLFATQTMVSSGTEIQIGWIANNVNSVVITPFGTLQGQFGFVTTTINTTTTFAGTATNSAGTATDTITITVSNGCDDATAVLKNTDGTILSTTDIPSGDTQDIIAPDGHVHIKKANDGTIANVFVASGATELYVVQNNDVEINGVKEGEVHATETVEIDLEDSGGNPVTPTNVTQSGNIFTVELPSSSLSVDFSVDDTTPDTNQTVTFTDLTVGATSWLWDFGDGNLSTLQNPTHQYKTTGTYTVTLCASDGTISGKEVKTNYITVSLEAEVTTNLIASYNAGNVVDDGSGNASEWTENVNTYNATQGTLINRPLIVTNDLNGFTTLQFDGSNDQLLNNNVAFATTTSTVYIVFRRARIHTSNEAMHSGANAGVASARLIYNPANEVSYFPRNQTLARGASYGNNVNQWLIMAVVFDGANSSVKFMQSAPAPIGNIGSTATFGIVIGASVGGAWFQGKIAEIKVYDVAHNAATQAQVIQRLQAKFNLYD